jgi:type II secretory pathway pseudopilin PulG
MPSFQAKRWFRRRASLGRSGAGAEDGFLLVEVIVSALLVGMIVVATFTGFDVVGRTSTEQRRHNAAAVLAAESQEQLRSDNSTTLLALERSPHSYTRLVSGTTYTVTQKATFGNGSSTTGCSATEEGTKGKGTYIAVSSSVTWPGMTGKAVTQSSIITPPTGSALTVEVNNGNTATPTSGVTIAITYTAVEASGTTTLEATTGSAGCVLFAGIPATSAKLKVRETSGIVNKQGTLTWPEEELTLAPNVLTNHQVVLAPGGAITATFAYEGSNRYKHKQNDPNSAEIEEAVTGDTFVVYNANMKEPLPDFQTGSNQVLQNFPGGLFEVLPGSVGSYKGEATTQKEPTKYARGNLFPFPANQNWTVYAGDCESNDPEELTKALATKVTDPTVLVTPAANPSTAVPTTYVLLNVYNASQTQIAKEGANAWKYLETGATSFPVTVTNVKCAGVTPKNETALNNKHVQGTTTGPIWGGHLEAPFQPYGEYELCLFAGGKTYTPKKRYNNLESAKKNTVNIYLGEQSKAEKEATRTAEEQEVKVAREKAEETARIKEEEKEAATRIKREVEEKPAREKREKEEKTQKETKEKEEATKATREAKEKAERETWKTEEQKKIISKKEREAKETTQTANRKTAEKTEEKADEKRKAEEATTKATKTTEEANKKKAEEKEKGTEQTRIKSEDTARKAAEGKETETKNKAITKENEEIAAKEVTIESGRSSC